jgi:hypothetical protein
LSTKAAPNAPENMAAVVIKDPVFNLAMPEIPCPEVHPLAILAPNIIINPMLAPSIALNALYPWDELVRGQTPIVS